jgi:hypothetical protein
MDGPPAYLPPTYLPWALVSILLFWPGAVVAIVYSLLVRRRLAVGDWVGASHASRLARTWCVVSISVGVVLLVLLLTGVLRNPYASH